MPDGRVGITYSTGPVTEQICRLAAKYAVPSDTKICLVTGRRGGIDGQHIMRRFLLRRSEWMRDRIVLPNTKDLPFTTHGEMKALVQILRESFLNASLNATRKGTVYLVARWWHLPRAKALLRKQLGRLNAFVEIKDVPVASRDILLILREWLFAWPKNWLAGNF
jgi:hypothetical protein